MSDEKVSSDSKAGESLPQSTAQAVAQLVKEVPIYQDALQPGAKEIGRGLGGLLAWLMQPFVKLGINAQKNVQKFESEFAEKVKDVPVEKLEPPDPMIVGPAMQALSYTAHHDELRRMFVNLMASASVSDRKEKAHPSFVEIVKQLSPKEALLLKSMSIFLLRHRNLPCLRFGKYNNDGGHIIIAAHINEYFEDLVSPIENEAYMNNFQRLGLIEVDYSRQLSKNSEYDRLVDKLKEEIPDLVKGDYENYKDIPEGEEKVMYAEGAIILTEYGKRFLETCVS